jgi:hypothetical protein
MKMSLRYPLQYRLKRLRDGTVVMEAQIQYKDDKLNEWKVWEDLETVNE